MPFGMCEGALILPITLRMLSARHHYRPRPWAFASESTMIDIDTMIDTARPVPTLLTRSNMDRAHID